MVAAPNLFRVVTVATVSLMTAALLFGADARAQTVYEVKVGRLFKAGDLSRESMRFYPGSIKVHQGDVLHFTSDSFHSVALLPAGSDLFQWTSANAGGANKPWSIFQSDIDDGPSALKVNPAALYPSGDCGWSGAAPCSFVGEAGDEGVLSSGVPFSSADGGSVLDLDFSVSIDADPGQTFWAVDLLYPRMAMAIEVVDFEDEASNPAQLETSNSADFQDDVRSAAALHKRYVDRRVSRKVKGKTVWTAWAGVENATVALRKMYPASLTVRKGQSVKWIFSLNRFSAHTVTFPAARANEVGSSFPDIACDLDGDIPEGDLETPDEPPVDEEPSSETFPYCANPAHLELDVPDALVGAMGNGTVSSAGDVESSGVRGAGVALSKAAYTLKFTKPSRKAYSYGDAVSVLGGLNVRGKLMVKP